MPSQARAARATRAYATNSADSAGHMSPQAAAAFASLQQQVLGLEGDFVSVTNRIEASIATMGDRFGAAIEAINKKIDAQNTTPWVTYIAAAGLMMSVMSAVGYVAYSPMKQDILTLAMEAKEQREKIVPRVEHEREWARMEKTVTELRTRTEKNTENLVTKESFQQQVGGLQRQVDEIRKDVGGVITTRDVLQNLEKKIDRQDAEIRAISEGKAR